MTWPWIAARVILEVVRDRRTLAFFLLVPVVVMTLVYYAVREEEVARIAVVTRGAARLFDADMLGALRDEEDVQLVTLPGVPDDVAAQAQLEPLIEGALERGEVDGVLYMDERLLADRVEGERGTVHMYLDGSRPGKTAAALKGVRDSMDELADSLPTIIDASCSAKCANSVNAKQLDMQEHYLYGDSETNAVDYFLPVLPPFFVFFFTFILSAISFQRERIGGTLERMLVAPVSFADIVVGYTGGFVIFANVQAAIVVAYFLELTTFEVGPTQLIALSVVVLLLVLIGLLLGLLASFVSHNEFQAIQFIPLVVLPQIFLSDIIWDIELFPDVFRWISYGLPLTHANTAVRDVLIKGRTLVEIGQPLAILAGFVGLTFVLLMLVGRRRAA